jgi:hypothetical protein
VIGLLVVATLSVLIGFVLFTMTRLRELNAVRVIGTACLSLAIGFLLMYPIGMLFDVLNLPLFNTWALAHATFIVAWPILTAVGFLIVRAIGVARKPTTRRS